MQFRNMPPKRILEGGLNSSSMRGKKTKKERNILKEFAHRKEFIDTEPQFLNHFLFSTVKSTVNSCPRDESSHTWIWKPHRISSRGLRLTAAQPPTQP